MQHPPDDERKINREIEQDVIPVHHFFCQRVGGGSGGGQDEGGARAACAQLGHEPERDLDFAHADRVNQEAPRDRGNLFRDASFVNSEPLRE